MTFTVDDFYQPVYREQTSYIVYYGRFKEPKPSYQATSQRKKRKSELEATFNSNHVSKEEGGVYLISLHLIYKA